MNYLKIVKILDFIDDISFYTNFIMRLLIVVTVGYFLKMSLLIKENIFSVIIINIIAFIYIINPSLRSLRYVYLRNLNENEDEK